MYNQETDYVESHLDFQFSLAHTKSFSSFHYPHSILHFTRRFHTLSAAFHRVGRDEAVRLICADRFVENNFVRIFLPSGEAAETIEEVLDAVEAKLEAEEKATGDSRKQSLQLGPDMDHANLFWLRVRGFPKFAEENVLTGFRERWTESSR
jgi:hypothetical protein